MVGVGKHVPNHADFILRRHGMRAGHRDEHACTIGAIVDAVLEHKRSEDGIRPHIVQRLCRVEVIGSEEYDLRIGDRYRPKRVGLHEHAEHGPGMIDAIAGLDGGKIPGLHDQQGRGR